MTALPYGVCHKCGVEADLKIPSASIWGKTRQVAIRPNKRGLRPESFRIISVFNSCPGSCLIELPSLAVFEGIDSARNCRFYPFEEEFACSSATLTINFMD